MCALCCTSPTVHGCSYCDPCDEVRRKKFAALAAAECRRLVNQALHAPWHEMRSETIRYGGGRMLITIELVESIDT